MSSEIKMAFSDGRGEGLYVDVTNTSMFLT